MSLFEFHCIGGWEEVLTILNIDSTTLLLLILHFVANEVKLNMEMMHFSQLFASSKFNFF